MYILSPNYVPTLVSNVFALCHHPHSLIIKGGIPNDTSSPLSDAPIQYIGLEMSLYDCYAFVEQST